MPYLNSRLTRPVRISIMMFLIICFFILAPVIILYTAGYRYDFHTNKIKQTGVISIDAEPSDAEVYLNEVKIEKSMPIRLPNRAPGSYKITLKKDGYKTWSKDILVESQKTSYIKDISLLKEALPIEMELKGIKEDVVDFYPSNGAEFILILTKQDFIYQVYLLDVKTNKIAPIVRTKSLSTPVISWSPFESFAFIKTKESINRIDIQLIDAKNNDINKTYTFKKDILGYQWVKKAYIPAVYIKQDDALKLINTNEEKNINKKFNYDIWHIDDNEVVWYFDNSALTLNSLNENDNNFSYLINSKIEKVVNKNDNRIIIKTGENVLVLKINNNELEKIYTLSTQDVYYNLEIEEWVTWSPWEMWGIYKDGTVYILNRSSDKIKQILPLDEHGTLLIASENKITAFNPGYYVSHELSNDIEVEKVGANTSAKKIYILGSIGGKRSIYELEY